MNLKFLLLISLFSTVSLAKNAPGKVVQKEQSLLKAYSQEKLKKKQILELKKMTLSKGAQAVPDLITVMKEKSYPDKSRWVATFMLGRIMGKKASKFIAKFSEHPNWLLRLASLKTLLSLKDKEYAAIFARSLEDKSLLVRAQALENIRRLDLAHYAPHVWKMLFDKNNYTQGKKGRKRTYIISKAIQTLGDLKFKKAEKALSLMNKNKRYQDLRPSLSYALNKLKTVQ